MTREQFYQIMREPSLLSLDTLADMQMLSEAYPYCATFSFLYLYNLAIVDDVRFSSELRRKAPLLPDRRKLYRMVSAHNGAEFLLNVLEPEEQDGFELIDEFLGEMRAAGADLPEELVYAHQPSPGDYFSQEQLSSATTDDSIPRFSTIAADSDGGNMMNIGYANHTPSEIGGEDSMAGVSKTPLKTDKERDKDIQEELFTETLAKIYIKQQRYDKALRIIQTINLNFPEKNRYFADQIRFLEKLINNNN